VFGLGGDTLAKMDGSVTPPFALVGEGEWGCGWRENSRFLGSLMHWKERREN